MNKIVPHLWFDREADDAATMYMSIFDDSRLLSVTKLEGTPSGNSELVSFELAGQPFMAISAGPYFKFNPSVSLMVSCGTVEEVDAKWNVLSEGGTALMELGAYPFSRRYGWIQDKYGLSWQLMLSEEGYDQKITPSFLFSGEACGKAEEAIGFYTDVFRDSETVLISRYGEGESALPEAKVNYSSFKLLGMSFSAMDNGYGADFGFNESFSVIVRCDDQEEIDYYWSKLSAFPEAEQCGWLKDRFGVSWQIVPSIMDEVMSSGSEEEIRRLTQAFLKMKKFDISELERARRGDQGKRASITVETVVNSAIEDVWNLWTAPEHIMGWNSASGDWHTPSAENDLRPGGSFSFRMEARDGSFGFDFGGVYDEVEHCHKIAYTISDGRRVEVTFTKVEDGIRISETFEAEEENSLELQRTGWQAILDSFRRYSDTRRDRP